MGDFEAFFRGRYGYHALMRYLVSLGANLEDAADVAQETCVEVWKSWKSIDDPRPWSRTVARRKFFALRRKDARRSGTKITEPTTGGGEVALDLQEETQQVIAAIRSLPLAQREVAALHYDGFGNVEIAEMLGKKVATVASLLCHAKRRLRAEHRVWRHSV